MYHILNQSDDFKNEKSQMKYILEDRLKVRLRMTPKCHPEIAGQGIEYAWGYAKLRFRQYVNDAEGSNLERNVRASLSTEVLTNERISKFIRKSRDYKLTYLFLVDSILGVKNCSYSHNIIEAITKKFKHHRSALDSDFKFILTA